MKKLFGILGIALLTITLSFTGIEKRTVVIDVGHGGDDTGVVIDGITEKEITFSIASKIKELNTGSTIEIVLTRDSDRFTSLDERVKFINSLNPEYVISLHVNRHNNAEVNGVEFFVTSKDELKEKSIHFAKRIQGALEKESSAKEIKQAGFYILKNVNCPAALIELGYLTNPGDKTSDE